MARVTKTLQLDPITDNDLLEWFNSLPEGQGQRLFKAALRKGLGLDNGRNGGDNSVPEVPPSGGDGMISILTKLVEWAEYQAGLQSQTNDLLNKVLAQPTRVVFSENSVEQPDEIPAGDKRALEVLDDVLAGLDDWMSQ